MWLRRAAGWLPPGLAGDTAGALLGSAGVDTWEPGSEPLGLGWGSSLGHSPAAAPSGCALGAPPAVLGRGHSLLSRPTSAFLAHSRQWWESSLHFFQVHESESFGGSGLGSSESHFLHGPECSLFICGNVSGAHVQELFPLPLVRVGPSVWVPALGGLASLSTRQSVHCRLATGPALGTRLRVA